MCKANLVSIIVPTNNRADLLSTALNSIMNQTYKNWETIVVANNCCDHTSAVMDRYLKNSRFHFINIPDAIGGAAARNVGLQKARGKYIAFLDDDDEWMADKLQIQLDVLLNHPGVAIVSSNFLINYGKYTKYKKFNEIVSKNDLKYENALGSFSFCLTKAEFIKDLQIDNELRAGQDWSFWFDILHHHNMNGYVVQKALVKYNAFNQQRLSDNKRDAYESYLFFINKIWSLMNLQEKSWHQAIIYSRYNQLIKKDYFKKFRLSLKTLHLLILSKKKNSIRKIINLIISPLFNVDAESVRKLLH